MSDGCFNPRVLAGGRDSKLLSAHYLHKVSIHASSREDATDNWQKFNGEQEFQSTRPRGRTRHCSCSRRQTSLSFNPRVLAGGRDPRRLWHLLQLRFQSTRPRGRTRPDLRSQTGHCGSFNPRVLAGGRDTVWPQPFQCWTSFQSTRPRGRTRRSVVGCLAFVAVSIHASSREDATCYPLIMDSESIVSIHASSREDATMFGLIFFMSSSFNPRVLAGGRDIDLPRDDGGLVVSIHASSREDATSAG